MYTSKLRTVLYSVVMNLIVMNIFVLSICVGECAAQYMWKHCIKIILEITQMMSAELTDEERDSMYTYGLTPYRPTHKNHPMTKWVNRSMDNYQWSGWLAFQLCTRYTNKYHKVHKCSPYIIWMLQHITRPRVVGMHTTYCNHVRCRAFHLSSIPQCMPVEFKDDDPVVAYQSYYTYKRITMCAKPAQSQMVRAKPAQSQMVRAKPAQSQIVRAKNA
jgi:hypothetical protein